MDEPLGALDAEFRDLMCGELRELHDRLGATTVYVTHDQLEAMAMADKIAVMNDGVIEQFGPPQEIYDRPASMFVADFIGSPPMNFLPFDGGLPRGAGRATSRRRTAIGSAGAARGPAPSPTWCSGVRPEHVRFDDARPLRGEVFGAEYLGTHADRHRRHRARARSRRGCRRPAGASAGEHGRARVSRPETLSLFDEASGGRARPHAPCMTGGSCMADVVLDGVTKRFGDTVAAVDDLSLDDRRRRVRRAARADRRRQDHDAAADRRARAARRRRGLDRRARRRRRCRRPRATSPSSSSNIRSIRI